MAEEQLGFDMPEEGPHKPETSRKAGKKDAVSGEAAVETAAGPRALGDDETIDYITGQDIFFKLTEAEKVRQQSPGFPGASVRDQSGRHGNGGFPDNRDPLRPAKGTRKSRKKVSIAVFKPGESHRLEHLRRIVITKPRPRTGRTVTKIRHNGHEQATNDIEELQSLMAVAGPQCHLGLWTDDIDLYFVERVKKDDEGREIPVRAALPSSAELAARGRDTAFDAARDASSLAEIRRADA